MSIYKSKHAFKIMFKFVYILLCDPFGLNIKIIVNKRSDITLIIF